MKSSNYILSSFFVLLATWMLPAYGNEYRYIDTPGTGHDAPYIRTGVPAYIRINQVPEPESPADEVIESQLLNPEETQFYNKVDRKALFHFLQSDQLKKAALDKKKASKLYGRLAKVFVRMKMYPLAMQYYFKTAVAQNPLPADLPALSLQDTCYQNSDLLSVNKQRNNNSVPVSSTFITSAFDDGKEPVAYAVIIHVKQPLTGKRKSFTGLNNVGHMFITLIKYNADSSAVSRSFGFYPRKDYLLSATPLRPATSSVFKNDALHDWDESVGKFISEKRFKKIIRLIGHYENRSYHLNKNNCTDFGLYAADIAGISIEQSNGSWPLGSGNNPANTGQSVLEGKFRNADTYTIENLFVCTDGND